MYTKEIIEHNFTHHKPKDEEQVHRYEMIRERAKVFAQFLLEHTPSSREQTIALKTLEDSIFWANASIARNE